jgi:xanthine/CO dehydrogenase XdhC/CoxF family maturation factor
MAIYEPLLLALLEASGAGRYSLDHLIGRWARRAVRLHSDMPNVVIVGAGFGGMACAAALRHEPVRVTLIDRRTITCSNRRTTTTRLHHDRLPTGIDLL